MKKEPDSFQTILLADVANSARLHEKLGAGEAQWAIDRCLKRMERSVEAWGGRLVKVVGNELMAVFVTADAAFQSAIDMQQRVGDLPPVSGLKLEIRVGFTLAPFVDEGDELLGEVVDRAACLVGMAEPGQLLTSNDLFSALSHNLQQSTRDLGLATSGGKFPGMRAIEVFALPTHSVVKPAASLAGGDFVKGQRLLLRYDNKVVILDDNRLSVRLGRDVENDIVAKSHRVSRNHAQIEKRGDSFVLTDKSTNGSYLTQDGKPELPLRRVECVIHGKGMISLAAPAASPDADCLEFEQL
jgi:adenylate cyclase